MLTDVTGQRKKRLALGRWVAVKDARAGTEHLNPLARWCGLCGWSDGRCDFMGPVLEVRYCFVRPSDQCVSVAFLCARGLGVRDCGGCSVYLLEGYRKFLVVGKRSVSQVA